MGWKASQSDERRRDPRVSPRGRVRISPAEGRAVEGALLDVSARGLRLAAASPPVAGCSVRIEIHLQEPGQPERLVLDGSGRVVWIRTPESGPEAGVAFDRPVDVRSPFSDLLVI